jgi:hypothetical protein
MDVQKNYHAQESPNLQSFHQIFEYRGMSNENVEMPLYISTVGMSRICMLRLIATLTYASNDCNISDGALLSFLRIGYLGSQKIKTLDELDPLNEAEKCTWIEREQEIFRSPVWTVFTGDKVDTPVHVASEDVMGPTALVRLLVVLAERGLLSSAQSWSALPDDTSSTSLGQVKQITSPNVIRAIIKMASKRVVSRRRKGLEFYSEGDCELARVTYTGAAELAAALIAFGYATEGKWCNHINDAPNELALSLGEAAEMALSLKQYYRALNFSLGAVVAGESPSSSGTVAGLAKNKRRVARARSKLPREGSGSTS